jgi:hypothetical protein
MMFLLIVIAVVLVGVPLAAVILVSFASRREESLRSVRGRAPGSLESAARRLLAFHADTADTTGRPVPLALSRGPQPASRGRAAVREPMAPVG